MDFDDPCFHPIDLFLSKAQIEMNPLVDAYLDKTTRWQKELKQLRAIALDCLLTEEFKWRVPCYAFQNANIVLLGSFKDCCTFSFFKGTLLQDPEGILVSPGENSQSVKMAKFTSLEEIIRLKPVLKAYLFEAIEVEKAGLKVELTKSTNLDFPEELEKIMETNAAFKKAFLALTPGRQRAYNLFFTAAKQSKTREARIEKYIPQILAGKGISDCTCGLSKKMPYCDGSHKAIR